MKKLAILFSFLILSVFSMQNVYSKTNICDVRFNNCSIGCGGDARCSQKCKLRKNYCLQHVNNSAA